MPLQAGILPDDEVGNCRQFAHLLRHEAQPGRALVLAPRCSAVPGAQPQVVHRYMPPAESTQLVAGPHGRATGRPQNRRRSKR